MTSFRLFLTAAAFAAAAPAFAQQPAPAQPSPGEVRASVMQACGAQINELCSNVQAGKGRVAQCLKSHRSELTPQCKAKLAEAYALKEEQQP